MYLNVKEIYTNDENMYKQIRKDTKNDEHAIA